MSRNGPGLIVLLTDFGTRDWYVAALKGVILSRAPRVQFIDITHEIPPQDIVAGAFILAAAAPWFPPGTVFVAIVDPGVGSGRALLAARADGRYFIGPDNGLLGLSLERARQLAIVQLTNRRYWLKEISPTFHGRDILSPVVAYLTRGGSLERLGPPLRRVRPLALPPVRRRGRTIYGEIVHIDAFGNLITNLQARLWDSVRRGERLALHYHHRRVPVVSSYADGRPHQLIAALNSLGLVELAVREDSAARLLNARRGDRVALIV
jgi:S-adenosylmethionine hydrolase